MVDYLFENEVNVTNKGFKNYKYFEKENIINQIILANAVHNILKGYYMNNNTRINSVIGKRVENIKVEVKRAKQELQAIEQKKDKNLVDYFLLDKGEIIIDKADDGIALLKQINYYSLIERSMKRNEICLGKIDEENLRALETIEIGSIKNISYNLVEEDILSYLIKVRRRNSEINTAELVNIYIQIAKLNQDSKNYLDILLSIPWDLLKLWKRYRQNKYLTEKECLEKMKKCYSYEIGGGIC